MAIATHYNPAHQETIMTWEPEDQAEVVKTLNHFNDIRRKTYLVNNEGVFIRYVTTEKDHLEMLRVRRVGLSDPVGQKGFAKMMAHANFGATLSN